MNDDHPIVPWLTMARRAWLYRVLTTAGALLAFYGGVAEEALPLWLALGAGLLGTTTAVAHTPTK